jgi:hypothetical protein
MIYLKNDLFASESLIGFSNLMSILIEIPIFQASNQIIEKISEKYMLILALIFSSL